MNILIYDNQKEAYLFLKKIVHLKDQLDIIDDYSQIQKEYHIAFLHTSLVDCYKISQILQLQKCILVYFGPYTFLKEAYEFNAYQYIEYFDERSTTIIKKSIAYARMKNTKVLIYTQEKVYEICPKDILYIESYNRKQRIFTREQEYYGVIQDYPKIKKILENDSFLQVHQNYIVNMNYIYLLKKQELELTNHYIIPCSTSRKKMIKEKLGEFVKKS